MSAAAPTRIFGVRLGIDPKILILGLVVVAGLLFWYNSRGDEEAGTRGSRAPVDPAVAAAPSARREAQMQRRRGMREARATLKLRQIDATRGDVDPVLRLDLLDRLASVRALSSSRNLFESAPAAAAPQAIVPVRFVPPKPMPGQPGGPPVTPPKPVANIPLKYYGYAKPLAPGEPNRGFFLDGDNIVVAIEGQIIKGQYRVLQITAGSARLEDTQLKLSQTLPVVPEAGEQPGMNQPGMNQNMMNQQLINQSLMNQNADDQ